MTEADHEHQIAMQTIALVAAAGGSISVGPMLLHNLPLYRLEKWTDDEGVIHYSTRLEIPEPDYGKPSNKPA